VLFGSRARCEGRVNSDYDAAVFLKSMPDRWHEFDRLADVSLAIADETGSVVNALPYMNNAYHERTPLMGEIRREGVDV
jgi:predicted nucleotidyltransferase